MTKYRALAVSTSYWKPGSNYNMHIVDSLAGKLWNGDFVVVSEKALSTATCNTVDESRVEPSANARLLASFWMRMVWGWHLGYLCSFGERLIKRLRQYPLESGSRHKQVALEQAGLMQALLFGSEGGIDGSNLPYSYVSLPLRNADMFAQEITEAICQKLGKSVCVIVADTDKTYRFHNFYFTPRPSPMRGIKSFGGVFTYLLGRLLKFKKSSTPLAVAGCILSAGEALTITNIADRARGPGSGATVWDMAARFGVSIDAVSWEMLGMVRHKPLVVVRRIQ